MSNQSNIIRVQCDISDPYRSLVNMITGGPVYLPRGRAIRFELGVRDKGIWQEILSANYASLTLEVRPTTRVGAALISKTVSSAAFVAASEGSWNAKSGQPVTVDLNSGDTGLAMSGALELDLWLVITASKISGGNTVTLAAGAIQMIEDGGQYSGNTPTSGDPQFYNAAQVDALLQAAMKNMTVTDNGFVARPTIDPDGIVSWDVRPA